ncbi:acyl carrier protein [Variovorax sp. OV700]|uniref:acyl carrier protein n=1 Tax=Variovorax sp. OV700 TaxID=1882826 RepID=UPI00087F3532|nr:acyl carrier protein [Variovorax sp. OV700]SDH56499.1 Phosphopantetheine attachment site [Variovorax sp. OV700]
MSAVLRSGAILEWIERFLRASNCEYPSQALESTSFHALGVDSALCVEMTFALGDAFDLDVDPTLIYDSRTVRGFAESVAQLPVRGGLV